MRRVKDGFFHENIFLHFFHESCMHTCMCRELDIFVTYVKLNV